MVKPSFDEAVKWAYTGRTGSSIYKNCDYALVLVEEVERLKKDNQFLREQLDKIHLENNIKK